VFTHPDRWREGIAAALLEHAEAAMRSAGYTEVQLWTPQEAPARHFYEATGWEHDGRMQWLAELALPIVAYLKRL
jgi:GNAT superfamily N-acetyltransferase